MWMISLAVAFLIFTILTEQRIHAFVVTTRSSSRTRCSNSLQHHELEQRVVLLRQQTLFYHSPLWSSLASNDVDLDDDNEKDESITLSEMLEDIELDIQNMDTIIEHDEEEEETPSANKSTKTNKDGSKKKKMKEKSRMEIKQLKFYMNRDVERLIQDNNSTAPDKAFQNIQRLDKYYKRSGNMLYKPNTLTWNMLVRAYAKSHREDAPELAEGILNQMKKIHDQEQGQLGNDDNVGEDDDESSADYNMSVKPNVVTYTEIIDAYAKSSRKDGAEKAEEILLRMIEEAQDSDHSDDNNVAPTSVTFDAVINAWARKGTRKSAERAEELLNQMELLRRNGNSLIKPTSYSFATVISAWSHSGIRGGESAERAEFILQRMKEFRKELIASGQDEYAMTLYPDRVIYNSIIDAWARSKDPRAGTKVEFLLNEMESICNSAEDDYMKSCCPDTISYNSVINCHANSGHINAAKAAEQILTRMETVARSGDTNVKANTRTYNQVLKAYTKSKVPGGAKRADMILKFMLQSESNDIKPDVVSFSTCLNVWAKSDEPNKAEMAHSVLNKMIDFHKVTGMNKMKPNEITYNTVLNACAFSAKTDDEQKKKALAIAVTLFKQMQNNSDNGVKPDTVTYGMLLKCIANLIPQGDVRNRMASNVFVKCYHDGLVNALVFDEIRRAVSPNIMHELLKDAKKQQKDQSNGTHLKKKPLGQWEVLDLPREWTCNVKEDRGHKHVARNERNKKTTQTTHTKKRRRPPSKKKKKRQEETAPKMIKPLRNIIETSWQSGRDL